MCVCVCICVCVFVCLYKNIRTPNSGNALSDVFCLFGNGCSTHFNIYYFMQVTGNKIRIIDSCINLELVKGMKHRTEEKPESGD